MKKALILLVVLVLLAGLLFGLYHFLWTADNFAALGEKAMKSGNYARAVDRYTTAVSLAPDNVDYVLALADACLADGSYTRAERTLVEAIRTAPSEQLYRRLSATYVAQDKLLDAQQMLDSITDPAIRASLEAARPAAPALTPGRSSTPRRRTRPMLSRSPSPQAPRMFPPLPSATTGLSVR